MVLFFRNKERKKKTGNEGAAKIVHVCVCGCVGGGGGVHLPMANPVTSFHFIYFPSRQS